MAKSAFKRIGTPMGGAAHSMSSKSPGRAYLSDLQAATDLADRKKHRDALPLLESLTQRHPGRHEALRLLADCYFVLGDMLQFERVMELLVAAQPHDPDLQLSLASVYLNNARIALAVHAFHTYLTHWPDHPQAPQARETTSELEPALDAALREMELPGGEEGRELARLHEQCAARVELGDYAGGRALANQLLRHKPDFKPSLNNLSQACALAGELDPAIDAARRVLELDPENIHALGNLVRFHSMLGCFEEARCWADRMLEVSTTLPDQLVKKAEAFSFVGYDADVVKLATLLPKHSRCPGEALLLHLAGAAALRLGKTKDARNYWTRALQLNPNVTHARANLEDLSKPPAERHAPWAFDFYEWVPRTVVVEIAHLVGRKPSSADLTSAMRKALQRHPELVRLVPVLLERGGPLSRQFAVGLASASGDLSVLEHLRDFALGQHGPDETRMAAARAANEAGLLPSGMLRFWIHGKWTETLLMGFEIHEEQERSLKPAVERLAAQAMEATCEGRWTDAERILKRALEQQPGDPSLLNNLAAAYSLQGRYDEALRITRELSNLHPDYFFAIIATASSAVVEGDLVRAHELLDPLLRRKRLHISEFAGLCQAQIQLLLAEGKKDGAKSWLEMWEQVNPEHPGMAVWRARLASPLSRLFRR